MPITNRGVGLAVGLFAALAASRPGVSQTPTGKTTGSLKPLMVVPGETVLAKDYAKLDAPQLDEIRDRRKGRWLLKGGTRCAAFEGALKLHPPSAAAAAAQDKWSTNWTRAFMRDLPADFLLSFRFKLIGVKGERKPPRMFFESGHHRVRINADATSVSLVVHDETETNDQFGVKTSAWQQVLVEIRQDEILVQFAGGPRLFRQDKRIAEERVGLQFGVIGKGGILLDDLVIRKIEPQVRTGWSALRAKLPNPTLTKKVKK